MTKRKMFLRMVTASLLRRRSRMLIALLSIGIGATILAGLVTIYVDVPRQMGAQFRSYGANMLLLPKADGELNSQTLEEALSAIDADSLVGAAPYRYVRLDMTSRQQSFTAAGTDFEQILKTSPYFSVEGAYPERTREVLVGKEIAETIGVRVGSSMELTYQPTSVQSSLTPEESRVAGAEISGSAEGWSGGFVYAGAKLDEEGRIASVTLDVSTQTPEFGGKAAEDEAFAAQFVGKTLPLTLGEDVDALSGATVTSTAIVQALNTATRTEAQARPQTVNFTVTGILTTGGEEEGYVFISLEDMQTMTGEDRLDVAELSVSAGADQLNAYMEEIGNSSGDVQARLVKRVTRSETAVLGKLQALVFLVTAVVLLLTMICVSTTMMAVVSERRREIGLRKALGASDGSIRAEFLGEGMFLGLLGGVMGAILGFVFAQVVSVNVFGSSITFQPLLLPAAVIMSMAVAAVSCLAPIKRAVAIDPALVLKGE
ncbi:MAG: FtsX-like permease family protein [Clostridia bacterium]|nr:FtsX-like permease family protein [Clostridia bacterium]